MSDFFNEHRKLAAIMFTDMVGYSVLSQRNEALALELIQEHQELLRSVFPKHQGTEVKFTGDGFLVEFASALAAVQCAVEIQKLMRQRNASRSTERRVLIRIGIHLGDIVRRGNDVFGDGVNIAARIEPLAEPGGICVSRAVYEQIENKVDHALVQLSKPTLKNIQATVEVYRLLLDETRAQSSISAKQTLNTPMIITGIMAVAVVIGAIGFLKFFSRSKNSTAGANSVATGNSPSANVPATSASSPSLAPWQVEYRVLHSFGPTNVEGVNPWGILTVASDGFVYGSVVNLGPGGGGSLYRLRTNGADYAVLHNFDPVKDGYGPEGVIEGSDGALYGVTYRGGTSDGGVIFRVARDGSDYRVLHYFAAQDDCRNPQYALLEAKNGLLYGTSLTGNGLGLGGGGIFRIAKDGSGYEIVAGFARGLRDHPRQPMSGLIQGADGAFYGTSKFGGAYDKGAVYRLSAEGKLTIVWHVGHTNGASIAQPEANVLQGSDGMFYVTSTVSGITGGGALFRITTSGGGYQVRWFGAHPAEAREPHTAVIEASDGSLLGTSVLGGEFDRGAVFRIGKDGRSFQTLHDFRGSPDDGARARSPLTAGAPGIFYGATASGGAFRSGVIFQLSIPQLAQAPARH